MVMELVDETDLAARLSLGPLEPADAAVLGAQVAAALDFLHARGTVHGAVRPDNILLGRDVIGTDVVPRARLTSFSAAAPGDVGPGADIAALGAALRSALGDEVPLTARPAPWPGLLAAMSGPEGQRPSAAQVRRLLVGAVPHNRPSALAVAMAPSALGLAAGAGDVALADGGDGRPAGSSRRLGGAALAGAAAALAAVAATVVVLLAHGPSTASPAGGIGSSAAPAAVAVPTSAAPVAPFVAVTANHPVRGAQPLPTTTASSAKASASSAPAPAAPSCLLGIVPIGDTSSVPAAPAGSADPSGGPTGSPVATETAPGAGQTSGPGTDPSGTATGTSAPHLVAPGGSPTG